MAETQEDKTFGVKTLLYKEPLFQAEKHRLLMAMGVAIPLLWLVSECVPSLPSTNAAAAAAAACSPLHPAGHSQPFPTWGTRFSKDLEEPSPCQTMKSSLV